MATNQQGDLICFQCSKKLTGRQKMYCSGKCRMAYIRAQNAHTESTQKPENERTQTHTNHDELALWQARYYKVAGQCDELRERVASLEESNRQLVIGLQKDNHQLTAAALDKAKYEGAYTALLESGGETVKPEKETIRQRFGRWLNINR